MAPHAPRPFLHAFSLVELLVVITIIAILAGLLLPTLSLVKAQAKQADCSSRMRQMGMMFSAYATGNDSTLPWGNRGSDWSLWYKALTEDTTNANTVAQGITDLQATGAMEYAKLFYCSEDTCKPTTQVSATKIAWNFYTVSHGYNSHGLGGSGDHTSFNLTPGHEYAHPAPLTQIHRPSETILCADNISTQAVMYNGASLGLPSGTTPGLYYGQGLCGCDEVNRVYPRHRQRIANILWVDGHVSGVSVNNPTDFYLLSYLGKNNGSNVRSSTYVDTRWDRE